MTAPNSTPPEMKGGPMEGPQPLILVVDDDRVILEGVSDLLPLSGYRVLSATSGDEGLRLMQEHKPDLIVSDVRMPKMDGYGFYEAVRRRPEWTTIPFIFLTALNDPDNVRRGIGLGADSYVVKPFHADDLLTAIESRLRRMREIRVASERNVELMTQRLLTTFGHELRTPLTHIYGYISLLGDREGLDEGDLDSMIGNVRRSTEHLVQLVEDVMLIARIDSGLARMEYERFRVKTDVAHLVRETARDFSERAAQAGVSLEVETPDDLTLLCLPIYISDALGRLVDNAIKFCIRDDRKVSLRAGVWDGGIFISVADTGIGVAPDRLPEMFKRFEQIDRERMEQQGIGIGLDIAHALVSIHGGKILVESEPGKGSTFTMLLPQVE